jgi:hypothetical protein
LSRLLPRIQNRFRKTKSDVQSNRRLFQITRQVARNARIKSDQRPIAIFNATTRLSGISLNAAFAYLAACGLQLAGMPVVYFGCKSGMSHCVLGTNQEKLAAAPPCKACVAQSRWLLSNAPSIPFTYSPDEKLAKILPDAGVKEMSELVYDNVPLGNLVLPSVRWALRRYHLINDAPTRFLFSEYLLSALCVAKEFAKFLDQVQPASVVVFNGIMFPEATARWVAQQRGLRVITHEVGIQPFSAFFTEGEATAYPMDIPEDFELSPEQNTRLDSYLEMRLKGKFSMAGIVFWPEISGLDQAFLQRATQFRQIVPIFTNVIFDTSQVYANTVFPDMFTWLDKVLEIIVLHPETLFVIRAHPDELRPGKTSHEAVQDWVREKQVQSLSNVIFINSNEYVSSYELIQRSKFVMVYNSSIGLEAVLMGAAVLCAGKARYTSLPTVFFPDSIQAYQQQAEDFLATDKIEVPSKYRRNARRYYYYQLYRISLPFGDFVEAHPNPGFVRFRPFHWHNLTCDDSPTMHVLVDGILNGKPFLMDDAFNL